MWFPPGTLRIVLSPASFFFFFTIDLVAVAIIDWTKRKEPFFVAGATSL